MTISSLTKKYTYSWDSNQVMWVRINKTQGTQDTPQTGGEGSGEGSEVVKSGFQITCYCVQSLLQTRAVPHAPQYTPMHARAHTHQHTHTHTPRRGRAADYLYSRLGSLLYSPYHSCNSVTIWLMWAFLITEPPESSTAPGSVLKYVLAEWKSWPQPENSSEASFGLTLASEWSLANMSEPCLTPGVNWWPSGGW